MLQDSGNVLSPTSSCIIDPLFTVAAAALCCDLASDGKSTASAVSFNSTAIFVTLSEGHEEAASPALLKCNKHQENWRLPLPCIISGEFTLLPHYGQTAAQIMVQCSCALLGSFGLMLDHDGGSCVKWASSLRPNWPTTKMTVAISTVTNKQPAC